MAAQLLETSTGVWSVTLDDVTQDWSFSGSYDYSTPGITAEWIEEDPSSDGGLLPFANYGSTDFTSVAVVSSDPSSTGLSPVYMTNASAAIVSYPGSYDAATDSFPVTYGSPSPLITTLSPDHGSTAGGTVVTIGGNFVTGVEAVKFGGVSVPFDADISDGTVTATAPAHSAGIVDVTVTTPGGTSHTTDADEFQLRRTRCSTCATAGHLTIGEHDPRLLACRWLRRRDLHLRLSSVLRLDRFSQVAASCRRHCADGGQGVGTGSTPPTAGIFAFGDSGFYGSLPGLGLAPYGIGRAEISLDAPIVGMVPSADGGGYFLVASDGGVFAFGDARFAGSCPGIGGCSGAAVAVMPDATGNGYWLVTQTGHVYTFGDAPYFGAPGPQNVHVTSAIRTPDGKWLLDPLCQWCGRQLRRRRRFR